jgi:hypothetical protein
MAPVPKSHVAYLLERINAVVTARSPEAAPDQYWNTEDLSDVSLEAAAFLRSALNVPALERELVSRSQVDAKALAEVTDWFSSIAQETPPPFAMTFPDGATFGWEYQLERIKELVSGLEKAHGLEEIEVGLRLAFVGDGAFSKLLMALDAEHELRARLMVKLKEKLTLLTDDQALAFWAALRREVDPSSSLHIEIDPTVASNDFFDLGGIETARSKAARYLATVQPLLVRKMFEKGASVPGGNPGIASVLAWTARPSTRTWSPTDRAMIRALCRVALCWEQIAGRDRTGDLADALGVQVGGYFVGGRGEQEAKRSLDVRGTKTPPPARILTELSKLLGIADQRSVSQEGSVERMLRAYKLGLEVVAQDIHEEFALKNELRLQREMCRFLVERSIRAYGTKFGWSEVDLRADDVLGAVVIETKVLKSAAPSERDINRWLTQLGSYLDQEHLALRGVLVLYNFSPTPIICPTATIRFRYLILSINVCPNSPSNRTASIEIVPTTEGSEIIRVHRFGEPGPKRRPGRKPRTRRKRAR